MLKRIAYKENQKVLSNFDLTKIKRPVTKGLSRINFSALGLKGRGLLFSSYVPFKASKKSSQVKLLLASNFFTGCGLSDFRLVNVTSANLTEPKNLTWQAVGPKQFKFASIREFSDVLSSAVRFWFDELELVGLGYRLTVRNLTVRFRLGFSHVVILPIPKDL
jgi:hypothetical protein